MKMRMARLWKQGDRLGFAVANAVLCVSWGFLGFGVLDVPGVFFLTVVAPGIWLAEERFGTGPVGRASLWCYLSGGAMLVAGLTAYRIAAALLVRGSGGV